MTSQSLRNYHLRRQMRKPTARPEEASASEPKMAEERKVVVAMPRQESMPTKPETREATSTAAAARMSLADGKEPTPHPSTTTKYTPSPSRRYRRAFVPARQFSPSSPAPTTTESDSAPPPAGEANPTATKTPVVETMAPPQEEVVEPNKNTASTTNKHSNRPNSKSPHRDRPAYPTTRNTPVSPQPYRPVYHGITPVRDQGTQPATESTTTMSVLPSKAVGKLASSFAASKPDNGGIARRSAAACDEDRTYTMESVDDPEVSEAADEESVEQVINCSSRSNHPTEAHLPVKKFHSYKESAGKTDFSALTKWSATRGRTEQRTTYRSSSVSPKPTKSSVPVTANPSGILKPTGRGASVSPSIRGHVSSTPQRSYRQNNPPSSDREITGPQDLSTVDVPLKRITFAEDTRVELAEIPTHDNNQTYRREENNGERLKNSQHTEWSDNQHKSSSNADIQPSSAVPGERSLEDDHTMTAFERARAVALANASGGLRTNKAGTVPSSSGLKIASPSNPSMGTQNRGVCRAKSMSDFKVASVVVSDTKATTFKASSTAPDDSTMAKNDLGESQPRKSNSSFHQDETTINNDGNRHFKNAFDWAKSLESGKASEKNKDKNSNGFSSPISNAKKFPVTAPRSEPKPRIGYIAHVAPPPAISDERKKASSVINSEDTTLPVVGSPDSKAHSKRASIETQESLCHNSSGHDTGFRGSASRESLDSIGRSLNSSLSKSNAATGSGGYHPRDARKNHVDATTAPTDAKPMSPFELARSRVLNNFGAKKHDNEASKEPQELSAFEQARLIAAMNCMKNNQSPPQEKVMSAFEQARAIAANNAAQKGKKAPSVQKLRSPEKPGQIPKPFVLPKKIGTTSNVTVESSPSVFRPKQLASPTDSLSCSKAPILIRGAVINTKPLSPGLCVVSELPMKNSSVGDLPDQVNKTMSSPQENISASVCSMGGRFGAVQCKNRSLERICVASSPLPIPMTPPRRLPSDAEYTSRSVDIATPQGLAPPQRCGSSSAASKDSSSKLDFNIVHEVSQLFLPEPPNMVHQEDFFVAGDEMEGDLIPRAMDRYDGQQLLPLEQPLFVADASDSPIRKNGEDNEFHSTSKKSPEQVIEVPSSPSTRTGLAQNEILSDVDSSASEPSPLGPAPLPSALSVDEPTGTDAVPEDSKTQTAMLTIDAVDTSFHQSSNGLTCLVPSPSRKVDRPWKIDKEKFSPSSWQSFGDDAFKDYIARVPEEPMRPIPELNDHHELFTGFDYDGEEKKNESPTFVAPSSTLAMSIHAGDFDKTTEGRIYAFSSSDDDSYPSENKLRTIPSNVPPELARKLCVGPAFNLELITSPSESNSNTDNKADESLALNLGKIGPSLHPDITNGSNAQLSSPTLAKTQWEREILDVGEKLAQPIKISASDEGLKPGSGQSHKLRKHNKKSGAASVLKFWQISNRKEAEDLENWEQNDPSLGCDGPSLDPSPDNSQLSLSDGYGEELNSLKSWIDVSQPRPDQARALNLREKPADPLDPFSLDVVAHFSGDHSTNQKAAFDPVWSTTDVASIDDHVFHSGLNPFSGLTNRNAPYHVHQCVEQDDVWGVV